MSESHKVIFTGQLTPGADLDQTAESFRQRFKLPLDKARKILQSGREVTLKSSLDPEKAQRLQKTLTKIGMQSRLDPPLAPPELAPEYEKTMVLNAADFTMPPEAKQPDSPYTATEIVEPPQPTDTDESDQPSDAQQAINEPASVSAGQGWQWIVSGWNYFKQSWLIWVVICVIWFLLQLITGAIPLVGSVALTLFGPVLFAGMMLGTQAQEQGNDLEIGHLFAGFKGKLGNLIVLGAVYLGGMMVIGLVSFGMIAALGIGGGLFSAQGDPEMIGALLGPGFMIAILIGMLLFIPLTMAYLFAPALIELDGVAPIQAMKMSFMGCLKNIVPFLVYSLILLVLLIPAALTFGLGFLVLGPIMIASVYAAYRDIYFE